MTSRNSIADLWLCLDQHLGITCKGRDIPGSVRLVGTSPVTSVAHTEDDGGVVEYVFDTESGSTHTGSVCCRPNRSSDQDSWRKVALPIDL
jgi:hypothetical protein